MVIGDIIKDLRLNKGLTQKEVADKIGISRSVLSQYESNLVDPTANVVGRLATFFEVSAGYLLGIEDDFGVMTAAPMGESLTTAERELLADFRRLSPYLQDIAKNTVRGLTGAGASDLQKKA